MDDLLARSATELFTRHCPPALVREIRAGSTARALWAAVAEAGFLDSMLPEEADGAGLGPAEVLPLLLACGRFAVPLPLGDTILARAALVSAGKAPPPGPILLAQATAGRLRGQVPAALAADWVLLPQAGETLLLPVSAARTEDASPLAVTLSWAEAGDAPRLPAADWLAAGAWIEVGEMAGAMERILEDTVRHAGERQQFGRPVAAFQAVQQQVSVLTEDVFAASIAARIASLPGGTGPGGLDTARVAAAKLRVGEAAVRVTAIAHAVHGAMGITEEFDLQLLTGRLHRGRQRCGSESYWADWLGREFLAGSAGTSLDFVRDRLAPAATEEESA
jgi:acyl-CoA dehydrogenase